MGSTVALPDKQREGVYGTAREMATCLKNEKIAGLVHPSGPNDLRPQLTVEELFGGELFGRLIPVLVAGKAPAAGEGAVEAFDSPIGLRTVGAGPRLG